MTITEALNTLLYAANERAQDARGSGHPLTAELLAINIQAAHQTLVAALPAPAPAPAPALGKRKASPCG